MGDPGRWRTLVYQSLWLGVEPELTAEEQREKRRHEADDARKAIGTPVAGNKFDEMKALAARAQELRDSHPGPAET